MKSHMCPCSGPSLWPLGSFFQGVNSEIKGSKWSLHNYGFYFIVHAISEHLLPSSVSSHFPLNLSLGLTFCSLVTQILLSPNLSLGIQSLLFLISFLDSSGTHPKPQISLPFAALSKITFSFPFPFLSLSYHFHINFIHPFLNPPPLLQILSQKCNMQH